MADLTPAFQTRVQTCARFMRQDRNFLFRGPFGGLEERKDSQTAYYIR